MQQEGSSKQITRVLLSLLVEKDRIASAGAKVEDNVKTLQLMKASLTFAILLNWTSQTVSIGTCFFYYTTNLPREP